MIIILPVTPLSKRCIVHEYGSTAVIRINSKDHLFQSLLKKPWTTKTARAQRFCTEVVRVEVPAPLGRHILESGALSLGYMLHREYINQMFEGVLYSVESAKFTATAAIKNFLIKRCVTEDDYSLESAYRAWQRFLTKKTAKKTKNGTTEGSTIVLECPTLPIDYVLAELLRYYDVSMMRLQGYPLKQQRLYLARKVIYFIAYKLCKVSVRELADKFSVNFRGLHKNISNTTFIFKNLPEDILSLEIQSAFDYIFRKGSPLEASSFSATLRA